MRIKILSLIFAIFVLTTFALSASEPQELKNKISTQHVEIEALVERLISLSEQIVQAEKQKKQLWQFADPETRKLNDQDQIQFDALQKRIGDLTLQGRKISEQLAKDSKKADVLVQRIIKVIMQPRTASKP